MTQHTDLIERLRCFDRVTCNEAADALESQSREIAALKEQEAELCTLYGLAAAECKRLRVKAARYDWLRDKANSVQQTAPMVFNAPGDGSLIRWTSALYGPELDNVLDAAIAAKGGRDG